MTDKLITVCVIAQSGQITHVYRNLPADTDTSIFKNMDVSVVADEPNSPTDYWDFDLHQFVSIGESPSPHHVFDYSIKQWVDPHTLDEIKNQKWQEIKKQRDALEFGGFEFDGGIYDSDQVSQGRIMGASIAGIDQVWTLADNTTRLLTAIQLQQLYAALQMHIAAAHERGRIARQLIYEATSKEQIDAIQL